MTRRIVVLPDTQIPYQNNRQLSSVLNFIGDEVPDEVIHIGDLMDFPQPARWSKDTRAEFEGSVARHAETGKGILATLRAVYDGPVGVIEGNHDLRPRVYFEKYCPALDSYRPFDLDVLLDFDGLGIKLLPDFYEFHRGWVATHGHLGFSLSRYAGGTAMSAARKMGKSVVMGHTHRAGVISESYGYGGSLTRVLSGVEVGHLMDMRKAHYLKSGSANWQTAFAIFDVAKDVVTPQVIPVGRNGAFIVDGKRYG